MLNRYALRMKAPRVAVLGRGALTCGAKPPSRCPRAAEIRYGVLFSALRPWNIAAAVIAASIGAACAGASISAPGTARGA